MHFGQCRVGGAGYIAPIFVDQGMANTLEVGEYVFVSIEQPLL
jgi:hypothetical protein